MRIGVIAEVSRDERRVALVPETVKKLSARGFDVLVERGAGRGAFYADEDYVAAGATLAEDAREIHDESHVLVRIGAPAADDVDKMADGALLLSLLRPFANVPVLSRLAARGVTAFALDLLPRITAAQSMDVLTSQANIAGYWAVVTAAARAPRYFPMLMTAAGTITPSRVLIFGAGVAGLQAIGTAHRLGAIVDATDVRPETKQQVESLGGRFVELGTADDALAAIARADVVITTALIPGKRAPILVSRDAVAAMRPGSVVVDLAAREGGNVEGNDGFTERTTDNAVLVLSPVNPPSGVPVHASIVFSRNVERFIDHVVVDGAFAFRAEDEIQSACAVTHGGDVLHPQLAESVAEYRRRRAGVPPDEARAMGGGR